jgi:SpoVK/Ycf46/Vps4 family AAA+-type ATPase
MNTTDFVREIKLHVEARYPIIWLTSFEERRAEKIVEGLCKELDYQFWSWSVSRGLISGIDRKKKEKVGREKILDTIEEKITKNPDANNLFILKDIATYFNSHEFLRKFRDIPAITDEQRSLNTICILSPTYGEIPPELEEDIIIIELSLPDYDEIEEMVQATYGHVLNEECIKYIQDEKQQIIKKQKILDYYPHRETMDHIGGLDEIKSWFIEREQIFRLSHEKTDTLGLDIPKGLLLIGVPGSGKSLCCKALAGIWNLPLLRMDVGKLFGSTVGESEKNIRRCIQLAEAVSPCIMWIDEIEIDEIDKAFGGITGFQGDSGTQLRVFGTFITWLQEKEKPVFVIATANEPKNLPAELWRKGRYDEVFFVDLPSLEEREEIFRIHLERKNQSTAQLDITALADNTQGYTGAEIEQGIKDAIVSTFNELHAGMETTEAENTIENLSSITLTQEALLNSVRNITPLSALKKEEIDELRAWSHQRARPASKSLFLQRAEMLTEAEKRSLAIHETGHTLMMWHHFKKAPSFISIDSYKEYATYIPFDEAMLSSFTRTDLEKEIGVILGGMVAEDEISGTELKTVGASHDLSHATGKAKKMVVEYGFGDTIKNTSILEVQDYALTSGKDVLDDIQKILNTSKEDTEDIITKNKAVVEKLVSKLVKEVLINNDGIISFFKENPTS